MRLRRSDTIALLTLAAVLLVGHFRLLRARMVIPWFQGSGALTGVAVAGTYAYLADPGGDMRILDVSTAHAPRRLGTVALPGAAGRVVTPPAAVAPERAYVVVDDARIVAVDVADPANASLIGEYEAPGTIVDLVADETQLYLALGALGWQAIRFDADGGAAVTAAGRPTGAVYSVARTDDMLLLAAGRAGLLVLDPAGRERGRLVTVGSARSVTADGDRAYVGVRDLLPGGDDHGLTLVDLTRPDRPRQLRHYRTDSAPATVGVADNYVYLIDRRNSTLEIIDVGFARTPFLAVRHHLDATFAGVALDEQYAYVADRRQGLSVLRITTRKPPLAPYFSAG